MVPPQRLHRGAAAVAAVLLTAALVLAAAPSQDPQSPEGKCMTCHKEKSPGLYQQWYGSEHALHGVTCYDCHEAERGEADAFLHEGAYISTLVTPKECGACHEAEAEEFIPSHHAKAGQILESADAYQANVVGGHPAAVAGCESCHGTRVELDPDSPNRIKAGSWPNSGIGRINPDGSLGACNACHLRHAFTKAQARQPETCGKCHLGPDHPQKEIYNESKHGIEYRTHKDQMNLTSDTWVVGEDYYIAPTCATCHLSATSDQRVTHDAGARISWTLRPPVSRHQEDGQAKREAMEDVCTNCHGQVWVDGHYRQFDGVVNLYDEKFGRPAGEIMDILHRNGSLEREVSFGNDVEWVYWELWHHEGRRARHGAAMMGPDYTWWHGIYEVGKHFYFDLLPGVRAIGDEEATAYVDSLLAEDPMHRWLSQDTETLKAAIRSGEIREIYRHLYGPGGK